GGNAGGSQGGGSSQGPLHHFGFGPGMRAMPLALALLLVPFVAGFTGGAIYARRRGRPGGRAAIAVEAVLVPAGAFAIAWVLSRFRVGVWDGLEVGALLLLGAVAGAHELHRRVGKGEVVLGLVTTALA